jgi:hypothetical protein
MRGRAWRQGEDAVVAVNLGDEDAGVHHVE